MSSANAARGRTRRIMRALLALFATVLVAVACACALVGCDAAAVGSGGGDAAAASASASADTASKNGASTDGASSDGKAKKAAPSKNGSYTSKDDVARYIHAYGCLPGNFISKTKARKAGWDSDEGNLDEVCPGKSIGGSVFYNDDGLLPEADGRTWKECDIDYHGGYRGAKRIVFSNDGLIYYTADHYKSFERLY